MAEGLSDLEHDLTDALEDVVASARASSYFAQAPYHPKAGCGCEYCTALRLVARVNDGGHCILCGCTQDDACEEGCAWADAEQLVCDAHPPRMIKAALRHFAKEARRG